MWAAKELGGKELQALQAEGMGGGAEESWVAGMGGLTSGKRHGRVGIRGRHGGDTGNSDSGATSHRQQQRQGDEW